MLHLKKPRLDPEVSDRRLSGTVGAMHEDIRDRGYA